MVSRHALRIASAVVALGLWSVARQAQAVEITGATAGTADGTSELILTIRDAGTELPAGQVDVAVSAGSISAIRQVSATELQVVYRTPRLATAASVAVSVEQTKTQAHAEATISLTPPAPDRTPSRSTDRFAIEVPRQLLLGGDTSAEVSFTWPEGDERPTLLVNIGTISEPVRRDDGRYHAVFTPPEERFPQMAVVVVHSPDNLEVGVATLPLVGRPVVSAHTEKRATVRFRVGDVDYGPVQARATGKVELPVLVPPGTEKVHAIARDRLGNERWLPLALGVPPLQRLLPICVRDSERALWVALDRTGQLERGAGPTATIDIGSLGTPKRVSPGLFESSWQVPETAKAGDAATLTLSLGGKSPETKTCTTQIPGEAPSTLALAIPSATHRVTDKTPVLVRATLTFPGKRKPRAVHFDATPSLGRIVSIEPVSATEYTLAWEATGKLGGAREATLAVQVRGGGDVAATARLPVAPGPASSLELRAPERRAFSPGETASLTVLATDAFDNPTTARLSGRARGTVGAFRELEPGRYSAEYTAPGSGDTAFDSVVVTDAATGATAKLDLRLRSALAFGIYARAGYATNFAKVDGPLGVLGGRVRPGALGGALSLGIEAALTGGSETSLDASGTENVTLDTLLVPISLRAEYALPLGHWEPYVAVNLGVAIAANRVQAESAGSVETGEGLFFASGGLGASYLFLERSRLIADAAYGYAGSDEAGITGNVAGAFFSLGYGMEL